MDGIELTDDANNTNLIYFDFCENFSLCYQCAMVNAYYKFCKICKKYISSAQKEEQLANILVCSLCKQHYHKECFVKEIQTNENCLYIWKFADN